MPESRPNHRAPASTGDNRHRRSIEKALAPALALTRSLPLWNASHLLVRFSEILRALGESALADSLIDEAFADHAAYERARERMPLDASPDHAFEWSVAHAFARAGCAEEAIRVALRLPPPSADSGGRETALTSLAQTFAWMGDIGAARGVLLHLRTPLARLDTLWAIAEGYARAGTPKQAAAAIGRMRGSGLAPVQRQAAWKSVAEWLAFRGDGAAALRAARAVRGGEERTLLLASLAEWAAAKWPLLLRDEPLAIKPRARRTKATTYLAAAVAAARRLAPEVRDNAFFQIGLAAARIGALAAAHEMLAQLTGTKWLRRRVEIRGEVARAEARAGRIAKSQALARRMARPWRAAVLADIAAAQAVAGDESLALATAVSIPLLGTQIEALRAIASAATAQGRTAAARRQLRAVAKIAIPDRARIRSEVIEALAAEQGQLDDFCGAARTLLGRRDYPHVPSFDAAALAFARAGNDKAALLLAGRARSADDRAELLARIALIQHVRSCARCRRQGGTGGGDRRRARRSPTGIERRVAHRRFAEYGT